MYAIWVNIKSSFSLISAHFNWLFGTLDKLSLYSCWQIHRFLFWDTLFSSLDPIFFLGTFVTSWLHIIQFYLKSLCSLPLDPNTVHLAFRYSFSIVHLFMVHHGLLLGFKFLPVFQQLSANCSMFTVTLQVLFTNYISSFCPMYFLSHLCA